MDLKDFKKKQCIFCGRITTNRICDKCSKEKRGKTWQEYFQDINHVIDLLVKDCMACPIRKSDFCHIPYDNPQSEEEERQLCHEYIKKWFESK